MLIGLTEAGLDNTLKHSIELLEEAINCKSRYDKDKLMYQVVGELSTLFRCVLIYTEEDKTDDATTEETV